MDRVATKLRYRGKAAFLYIPAYLTKDAQFPHNLKGEERDELDVVVYIEGDELVVRGAK